MFQHFQEVEEFFDERGQYGIKPGLERVEFLLENVGRPEQQVKGIHVAGTNGKGSTIQFIDDVLIAHNYQVGMFTSPSFTGITGHILLNGNSITENDIVRLMNQLLPFIRQLDAIENHPTPFEILTVLSFMYFQGKADIVLIETGMGGRYDTTNCFTPIISVITTISKDHTQFLGDTLEEIAYHKAGIIKKNTRVVTGNIDSPAISLIRDTANTLSAPLFEYKEAYDIQNEIVIILSEQITMDISECALQGVHQKENAATALMALALLPSFGLSLDWQLVQQSMMKTTLPGRFEIIHEHPTIILDSAHNIAGADAFKQTLRAKAYDEPTHLLFAGFYDKQLDKMLQQLEPVFTSMTVTTFDHPRAATLADFAHHESKWDTKENWQAAVDDMLKHDGETVFCITGSLHFITLVRQYINRTRKSDYR